MKLANSKIAICSYSTVALSRKFTHESERLASRARVICERARVARGCSLRDTRVRNVLIMLRVRVTLLVRVTWIVRVRLRVRVRQRVPVTFGKRVILCVGVVLLIWKLSRVPRTVKSNRNVNVYLAGEEQTKQKE